MAGILFLFVRVIASPVVNVFQKKLTNRGVNPAFIVLAVYLFFSILAAGYLAVSGWNDYPPEFWKYAVLLALTDALGNIFLILAIKNIDLSVFGPMNAYKPVIALLLSVFIVGEMPTMAGIAGVLIIISGSYFLRTGKSNDGESHWKFIGSPGILYRILSIILTSVAAVLSKKVMLMSSPLITLAFWSLMGLPLVYGFYMISRKKEEFPGTYPVKYFAALMVSFLILQVFSFYTFKYVFVGYSLALFQLSSVISVFFGSKVFKEENINYRYAASIIMVAGAVVIVVFG